MVVARGILLIMMLKPYLYDSPKSVPASDRVVVVLPEIYGLNDFSRTVADRAAEELGAVGVALDHFYTVTGESSSGLTYADHEVGVAIAARVSGEKYLKLLTEAIDAVEARYPTVEHVTILGFCFGGKLAYLSGAEKRVDRIVAFYGGGSLEPGLYDGESAVDALVIARHGDLGLKVLAIWGEEDAYIPQRDRDKIHEAMTAVDIPVQMKVYPAGHAFFNHDRADRFDATAAESAWGDVKNFLS